MTKFFAKISSLFFLGVLFLMSCISGGTLRYANFEDPHTYPVPGFGGEYVYEIGFYFSNLAPLPIEKAEGRKHSVFRIAFQERDLRQHTQLDVTLDTIRFINLESGKVYRSNKDIKGGRRIISSRHIDLPLGRYRIEISGRFCADGVCRDFEQSLEKKLVIERTFVPLVR